MPLLIFKPDNPNGPSNEQADVISIAYNACAGHEHYSSVQKLSNTKDEITVGEYEVKISVTETEDSADNLDTENAYEEDLSSFTPDKYGRKHLKYPHSGTLLTFIRNNLFHGSTCLEHINDLYPVCMNSVKNGKRIFLAFVDNGPEYSPSSYKNFIYVWPFVGEN